MPKIIQTRWHKLIECVQSSRYAIAATRIKPSAVKQEWNGLIWRGNDYPKFVIDPDLIEAMDINVIGESVRAMIEANVLRLPFHRMVLECTFNDLPDETFFAIIEDNKCSVVSFYAEAACVYPNKFDWKAEITDKASAISFTFEDAYLAIPIDDDLQMQIERYITRVIGRLMGVAFVVTNLQGVEREVVEVAALNKQRLKKNRPPVPRYTYLRIGHVYKINGDRVKYVKGTSTKVYMRRGHTRNQHFGKGNSERKLIYIEPVLVNYRDGNQPPPMIKVKM